MCVHVHVCMQVHVCACVLGITLAWSSPVRLDQLAQEPRSASWLHLTALALPANTTLSNIFMGAWELTLGAPIYTPNWSVDF